MTSEIPSTSCREDSASSAHVRAPRTFPNTVISGAGGTRELEGWGPPPPPPSQREGKKMCCATGRIGTVNSEKIALV